MKNYSIKLFNTRTEYEAFVGSDDYAEPHVSLCEDDNIVNYNIKAPSFEMVDLGLPSGLKWAKCNIGAEKETDYGMYFKFGDVVGHDAQNCNHDNSIPAVEVDGNNHLLPAYDAATQLMGAGYRMPTKEECEELINNTDLSFVTLDGVRCFKFSKRGDTNTYILFPWAGACYYDVSFYDTNNAAYWWSSTPLSGYLSESRAYILFGSGAGARCKDEERIVGCPVRGVSE